MERDKLFKQESYTENNYKDLKSKPRSSPPLLHIYELFDESNLI